MKQLLVSIAIVFASVLTVGGQNSSFSLSGTWDFQIDRQDAGVKEQWFNKSLDESINLPGSMPEKLKGDNVTARTKWTGSLYDSSYYFNPRSRVGNDRVSVIFRLFAIISIHVPAWGTTANFDKYSLSFLCNKHNLLLLLSLLSFPFVLFILFFLFF